MKRKTSLFSAAVLLLCGLAGLAALAQSSGAVVATYDAVIAKYGDGLRENLRIRDWHDEYTGGRAPKKWYPEIWDLSEIPAYAPKQQLSGTIRVSGTYLVAGHIAKTWAEGFTKFHPQVKVVMSAGGDLAAGQIDIQTGPRTNDRLIEASRFERRTKHRVFELEWATGSYNVPGWSPAFAVFVHKDNPLNQLSLTQLDGVFGGSRTGGWDGTIWRADAARGPEKNIRTWGQLGLTGVWADKPIHVYGRPLKYNIQLGFERKVFHGGDLWNESTREYSHELNPDGSRYTSAVEMVKDLNKDPYGICYSDLGSADMSSVKTLAIAATEGAPAYPLTLENLHARRYPLFIEQWAMVNQEPGKPLDPLAKEFLAYMLSRQGQDAIQRDGKWIPLPAAVARAQLKKLDELGAVAKPAEMGLQVSMLSPDLGDGDQPDETGKIQPRDRYYTRTWNLSDLPSYRPEQIVSGTIALPKGGELLAGTLGEAWMRGFTKYHPDVKFEQASGRLGTGTIDVVIGRKWTTYFGGEYMQYQLSHKHSPLEIQIATGSYDVSGWDPAFAIFVNKSNPLAKLTMAQLDGIFGGPRRGGWAGTAWRRQVGRTADKNIRTWGQLGLGGAWADKPIDVYTPPIKYHIMSVFERKVFQGGNMWNDALREYPLTVNPDGSKNEPDVQIARDIAADPYGITFSEKAFETKDLKALAVAPTDGGAYADLTLENVRTRTYPLFLEVFAYVDPTPGKPLDPQVREFLRYILSREGQDAVQRDGKWLPLTGALAREQIRKVETIVTPVAVNEAVR